MQMGTRPDSRSPDCVEAYCRLVHINLSSSMKALSVSFNKEPFHSLFDESVSAALNFRSIRFDCCDTHNGFGRSNPDIRHQ
jgi:hypothetical protein